MKFTVFDIETAGIRDDALALAKPFKGFEPLPQFDPKSVSVGNLKDPDKIAAKIRKAEETYPEKVKQHEADYEREKSEYEAKVVSSAALNALCGRVVAIGLKSADGEEILSGDEKQMLISFWERFCTSTDSFVGFNSNSFDVPFMVRRSWKQGVTVPPIFQGRYLDKRFVDLMEKFGCGEYGYKLSLNNAAKFLGVPGKFEGECSGESFAQLFESGDPVAKTNALEYLKCDLRATWAIAERLLTTPKEVKDENPFG